MTDKEVSSFFAVNERSALEKAGIHAGAQHKIDQVTTFLSKIKTIQIFPRHCQALLV